MAATTLVGLVISSLILSTACLASAVKSPAERSEEFVYSEEQPHMWRASIRGEEEAKTRAQPRVDASGNVEDAKYHEDSRDLPGMPNAAAAMADYEGDDVSGAEAWRGSNVARVHYRVNGKGRKQRNHGREGQAAVYGGKWDFDWVAKRVAAAFRPGEAERMRAIPSDLRRVAAAGVAAPQKVPSGSRKLLV